MFHLGFWPESNGEIRNTLTHTGYKTEWDVCDLVNNGVGQILLDGLDRKHETQGKVFVKALNFKRREQKKHKLPTWLQRIKNKYFGQCACGLKWLQNKIFLLNMIDTMLISATSSISSKQEVLNNVICQALLVMLTHGGTF